MIAFYISYCKHCLSLSTYLTSLQIIRKIEQFNSSNGKNGRLYDFRNLPVLSITSMKKLGSLPESIPLVMLDITMETLE